MANRKAIKKKQVIFLVGPTAVGKTAVAVSLAELINAEIVSCDSMQVYRGLKILASQPDRRSLVKVKHHLLNFVPLTRSFDVSQYRKIALEKIRQVLARNKFPLFCGGTGLYVSILIDGIFEVKAKDEALRSRLFKQAEKKGPGFLYAQLKEVDPAAAAKIHPNDAKRIIRALEVFKLTGKPISFLQKQRKGLADQYRVKIFCLNLKREDLFKRIGQRTEEMFKNGALKEAQKALNKKISRTASFAIGLREINGYLKGEYGLKEAKELIKVNTRAYARRQLTWFRKDKRIKWVNIKESDAPEKVAKRIKALL